MFVIILNKAMVSLQQFLNFV